MAKGWKNKLEKTIISKTQHKIIDDFNSEGTEYVEKTVQDQIEKLVYNSYRPKYYTRTGELLDSFKLLDIRIKDNKVTYEFGHDSKILRAHAGSKQFMSQHASFLTKEDVAEDLPYWIHYGHVHPLFTFPDEDGGVKGVPLGWYKPKPYRDIAVTQLRVGLAREIWN